MSYKSSGLVWIQKKIKTGKAVGPDGIPPEILKYYDIDEIINLDRLDQWSEDNLLPYQTVIILAKSRITAIGKRFTKIMLKVVNRMILNRNHAILDPLL